jgi:hypothetical protein
LPVRIDFLVDGDAIVVTARLDPGGLAATVGRGMVPLGIPLSVDEQQQLDALITKIARAVDENGLFDNLRLELA